MTQAASQNPRSALAGVSVPSSSLRTIEQVADLTTLFEPDVNIVTLRRVPQADLAVEAQRAADERRLWLFTVNAHEAAVGTASKLDGFPLLAADVCFWAEVLAELTDASRVGVRLAHVETALCPKFHVDRVTLRVVSTYLGSGTEYLSNECVDRSRLGHAAFRIADEASGLLSSAASVHTAEPFDVVFLKGEAWPNNEGFGAVHRSPKASGDSPRLVLTLDPLD